MSTSTFYIKHATENRFYTGEKKDFWKKFSTAITNAVKFESYEEAKSVLDRLNTTSVLKHKIV